LFATVLLALLPVSSARAAESLAEKPWLEARSEHFQIYSTGKESEVRDFALKLERMQYALSGLFALQPADDSRLITLYLPKDKDYDFFRHKVGGKKVESVGMATGNSELQLLLMSDGASLGSDKRILQHELSHAFLRRLLRRAPLWVHEGFAEVMGHAEVDRKEFLIGPYDEMMLRYGKVTKRNMPLSVLMEVTHGSKLYADGWDQDLFYEQSWALVHMFMMTRDQALRRNFIAYIQASEGLPVGDAKAHIAAFERIFGMKTTEVDRLVVEYLRSGSFPYRGGKFPENFAPSMEVRSLPAAEAAVVCQATRKIVQRDKESDDALRAALAGLSDSSNPYVCVLASTSSLMMQDWKSADQWAARAVALDVDNAFLAVRFAKNRLNYAPYNFGMTLPASVTQRMRQQVFDEFRRSPEAIQLVLIMGWVEAVAAKVDVQRIQLIEKVAKVPGLDEGVRYDLYEILAYLRWRFNDPATARALVSQIKEVKGHSYELAYAVGRCLEAGITFKQAASGTPVPPKAAAAAAVTPAASPAPAAGEVPKAGS